MYQKREMLPPGEGTPLLRSGQNASILMRRATQRRRVAKPCVLVCPLIVLPGLLLGLFAVFRCLVTVKMAQAWRQARRLDANQSTRETMNGVLIDIDPLQGARPAFFFLKTATVQNNTLAYVDGGAVPLAIVHGVEITARDMDPEAQLLAHLLPGTYVQSIEYVPGVVTYFTPLDDQFDALCERLRGHSVFGMAEQVDILGHSSGALMARAVAQNPERCFGRLNVTVRHYIGLAGPQQGVIAPVRGPLGLALAKLIGPALVALSRTWFVQTYIVSTAAYLYDPRHHTDVVFPNFGRYSLLGRLNQGRLLSMNDRLRSLDDGRSSSPLSSNSLSGEQSGGGGGGMSGNMLLIASMEDEVIRPVQSAFFSVAVGWNENIFGTRVNAEDVRAVCDTDLWRRDTIGFRHLWNQMRVFAYRSPTRHGPLPTHEYVQVVAPFLRGEIASYVGKNDHAAQISLDKAVSRHPVAVTSLERICVDQEVRMQVLRILEKGSGRAN